MKISNRDSYSKLVCRIGSYFSSPFSWTCFSSCCALCHHLTRMHLAPRGDGRREVARVPPCGISQGILWDWSPRSWGCEPRRQGAQPCASQQGCCWGAGSTQSWLQEPCPSPLHHICKGNTWGTWVQEIIAFIQTLKDVMDWALHFKTIWSIQRTGAYWRG